MFFCDDLDVVLSPLFLDGRAEACFDDGLWLDQNLVLGPDDDVAWLVAIVQVSS